MCYPVYPNNVVKTDEWPFHPAIVRWAQKQYPNNSNYIQLCLTNSSSPKLFLFTPEKHGCLWLGLSSESWVHCGSPAAIPVPSLLPQQYPSLPCDTSNDVAAWEGDSWGDDDNLNNNLWGTAFSPFWNMCSKYSISCCLVAGKGFSDPEASH